VKDCAEYAVFSRSEMDRRYARARGLMAERRLDALLMLRGGRFGHGQGMVTEPPSINPEDHTVLEVGMVISTEPGLRLGDVHFLWEDTHVITEDGHQQLTLETPELREIPF
jgi:Xaa-Pro aminopeptidase